MRRIGLLGGMSWESTAVYYRRINELVRDEDRRRGGNGLRSADLLIRSFDFAQVVRLQRAGRWDEAGALLGGAARDLVRGGAEAVLIATNTMHLVADEVQARAGAPLIHIADVTADALRAAGVTTAGLLATAFTMQEPFYRERLAARGVTALVPDADGRAEVHRVIFEELCCGIVRPESRAFYRSAAADLVARGAQALILGCTEICLLVSARDFDVPVFDTTELHARAAVDFALADEREPALATG